MTCYHPLKAVRLQDGGVSIKPASFSGPAFSVPCGRCIGCRLDRSRTWAIRCVHEASMYERNCFITLTYSDDHLPNFGALEKRPLQLFIKRLRKKFGAGIRFYACGEYGEQLGRPHYHACLFNHDFDDKVLWRVRDDCRLYTSAGLADLWTFGFSTLGDVTFESAAYIARYVMKKINGDKAESHYTRLVPETGELVSIPPEFTVMSRRPGIGRGWVDRYMSDLYPDDFCVVRGVKMKVPRYYALQHEKLDALVHYDEVVLPRREAAKASVHNTPERLKVRETIALSRISQLKRTL